MIRVLLKRNWFTPQRRLYYAGVHEFPDRFEDILPKSAEILEDVDEGDGFEEVEALKPKTTKPKTAAKKVSDI